MRPTARMPKLTRRSRILILIALGVIVLLLAGPRLIDAYVDWLWFGELGYRIGVPAHAGYRELLNTDADVYGGGNAGNLGQVDAEPVPMHGYSQSLALTLPPLAVVILEPRSADG